MFELSKKGLWTSHFLKPGEVWNKMQRPGRVNFCQPKGLCRPHQGKCHQMFSIWVFLACELALEMIRNAAYCCIMLIGLFYILLAAFLLFHQFKFMECCSLRWSLVPTVARHEYRNETKNTPNTNTTAKATKATNTKQLEYPRSSCAMQIDGVCCTSKSLQTNSACTK